MNRYKPFILIKLYIPFLLLFALASCTSTRPVMLDGQPVTGAQTAQWGNYLDNAESLALAVNHTVEAALDRKVITKQIAQDYIDKVAIPALLALKQAKASLITYEQSHEDDAFAQFVLHFNAVTQLIADAVAYATQYGLIQAEAAP